jgi:histidine ammonia-lyase
VQGIELRKPLLKSSRLQVAAAVVRDVAAFWDKDRAFAPDLAAMLGRVEAGAFDHFVAPLGTCDVI